MEKNTLNSLKELLKKTDRPILYFATLGKITGDRLAGELLYHLIHWQFVINKGKPIIKSRKKLCEELDITIWKLREKKRILTKSKFLSIKKGNGLASYYNIHLDRVIKKIDKLQKQKECKNKTNRGWKPQGGENHKGVETTRVGGGNHKGVGVESTRVGGENHKGLCLSTANIKARTAPRVYREYKESIESKKNTHNLTTSEQDIIEKIGGVYKKCIADIVTSGKMTIVGASGNIVKALKDYPPLELCLAIRGFSEDDWQMKNNGNRGIVWFFKDISRIAQYIELFNNSRDEKFVQEIELFLKE